MKTGPHWPGLCANVGPVGPEFLSWEFETLNWTIQKCRIRQQCQNFCPQWCQSDLDSALCEARIQPILVSSGCCSKWPRYGWLQTTAMHFLVVLEARSPRSARLHSLQRPQGESIPRLPWLPRLMATSLPSLPLSSHCLLFCPSLLSVFYKDTCHWM